MTVVEMHARIEQIRGDLGLQTIAKSNANGSSFASTLKSTLDSAGATGDRLGGGTTGDQVVASAEKYLGTPYAFGSTDPAKGLDCSALVQRAYRDLGIQLPRLAKEQAREGTAVPSLAQAKPGDLLAFHSPVDHIAIYLGNNQMIAAPKPGDRVKIQKVYETPSTIRRILPDQVNSPYAYGTSALMRPAALGGTAAVPYGQLFQQAGARHGVSPLLLAAVAKVESGYNPSAVSKAGAQGLMQIMPSTARGMGVNPLDPTSAVDGAARILAANLKEFKSVDLALAAYNAGGGAVRKYDGIPPFAETRAYVPKVKAAMAQLSGKGFA